MVTWLELLEPSRLSAVVDIGANPIDGDPPYKPMLDAGLCTVTGFEPQPEALGKLQELKGPLETYLPNAVGDGADHELKVTWMNGMTSLFEPDPVRLAALNEFARYGEVLDRIPVSTTRLDDVEGIPAMDLLKIDVQGAELMVFQNGRSRLSQAVFVHAEVAFLPLYVDQPLFCDVDAELRAQGFVPHSMAALKRWAVSPGVLDGDIFTHHEQLLEADVAYVKDFAHLDRLDDSQVRHLALIAHHVYSSPDLVVRALAELVDRGSAPREVVDAYGAEIGASITLNGVRSDR